MNSPVYAMLWPATGCLFVFVGVVCLFVRKWLFSGSLLLTAAFVLGSWQYDRSHETITKLHLIFCDYTLIKTNVQPELSIYHVKVCGLEFGDWEAYLAAKDIHTTKKPGSIIVAELRKRPLTGTYLRSIADQPVPQYTYVPPAEGREFDWAFLQPPPPNLTVEHVLSRSDRRAEMAKLALAFHTDRATFDRIRPSNLERVPHDDYTLTQTLNDHEIPWWKKPTNTTEVWRRNATNYRRYEGTKGGHFACERIVLSWDDDGLVQYFWRAEGLRNPQ